MEFVQHLVVLLHLIGFASLFGGVVVQVRAVAPEVNAAMLHGVLTVLVTGAALVVFAELGTEAVNAGHINYVKIGVKLVVTLVLAVLIIANRRFSEIPRGLWGLIGLGTLANAAVAVLWQ